MPQFIGRSGKSRRGLGLVLEVVARPVDGLRKAECRVLGSFSLSRTI